MNDLSAHYMELLLEADVTEEQRRKHATIVQTKDGKKRHRFPMWEGDENGVEHARKALQMLPKAHDLSDAEKAKIRKRAEGILARAKKGDK